MDKLPFRSGKMAVVFGTPVAIGIAIGLAASSVLLAIVGTVASFIGIAAIVLKLSPVHAAYDVGTRAWEARMTNELLKTVIERRLEAKAVADEAMCARLERELLFLVKQFKDNDAIIAANDASPGRGYVGFKAYRETSDDAVTPATDN